MKFRKFGFGTRAVTNKIKCNICAKAFRVFSRFQRFCNSCKESDELYRFGGWLPEGGVKSHV